MYMMKFLWCGYQSDAVEISLLKEEPRTRGSLPLASAILLHRPLHHLYQRQFCWTYSFFSLFLQLILLQAEAMPAQKRAYETVDVDLLPRLHDSFNERSEDGESEGTLLFLFSTLNFDDASECLMFLHFIYVIFCCFNSFSARVLSLLSSLLLFVLSESDRTPSSSQGDKDEYVPFMSSVFALLLFVRHLFRAGSFLLYLLFWFISSGRLWNSLVLNCLGLIWDLHGLLRGIVH